MDRTNRKPSWSFSGIKTFDQCPKKYYHLKVAKDYKETETDAMYYGTAFHKAAEEYIKGEVEALDPRFDYALTALDKLKSMEGEKLCEYQMG
jgi:PD-(D/E)XK nuclease superfamily